MKRVKYVWLTFSSNEWQTFGDEQIHRSHVETRG